MARALWSGAIAFGLVNIPVKLYGATETKDLSFTTLHATCMTALKRPYICPKDNVPVDSKEMVKGFEYAKGQYVILKDEDFEKIPLEATKALEVAGFGDPTRRDLRCGNRPRSPAHQDARDGVRPIEIPGPLSRRADGAHPGESRGQGTAVRHEGRDPADAGPDGRVEGEPRGREG